MYNARLLWHKAEVHKRKTHIHGSASYAGRAKWCAMAVDICEICGQVKELKFHDCNKEAK